MATEPALASQGLEESGWSGPAAAFQCRGVLLQWLYFAWRLQVLGPAPGLSEFCLVAGCPFHDKASRSGWEVSFDDSQAPDGYQGLRTSVKSMEVGRSVVGEVHPDGDAVEAA